MIPDAFHWEWWPADVPDSEKYWLPAGNIPNISVRLEPAQSTLADVGPHGAVIGCTTEPLDWLVRKIFFRPSDEHFFLEEKPGSSEVLLINTSIAAFVSSLGIFTVWRNRVLKYQDQGIDAVDRSASNQAIERDTKIAILQLELIDPKNSGSEEPDFWTSHIFSLGRLM